MRRSALHTILFLAWVIACAPTTASAADAERTGIGIDPATIVQDAAPGSTFTVEVKISNSTGASVRVTTNAVQARGASNGQSLVQVDTRASDDATRNAALWVRFPEKTFQLAAGARETVRIEVRVPDDARPGVHGALAMFSVPTTTAGGSGAGVQGSAGLGAALLFEVPGAARAAARIVSSHGPSVVRSGSNGNFRARVENTGDTLLRLDSELRLSPIVGASRVIGAEEQLALPGGQRTFRFRYDDPPLIGRYTPKLTVVGGTGSDVRVDSELDAVWVIPPWWLVAAFVAAVALAIAGTRARLRGRRG